MKMIIHLCDICNEEIEKGEKYALCQIRTIGEKSGGWDSKMICMKCFNKVKK